MKSKLVATYKENKDGLFQSLRGTFDKFLARDPVDWKRSFGRPSRNVFVQLTFDPFNPNSIALEESWLLCNRPFLHSFWIDCDLETYKSSVKDSVSEWLSQLRDKDIHDWLIVVVVNMDNRVKNKILRNSVYDKVKNDFCSKQTERCILLSEPYKLDSKSLESYNQVAARMRLLVVDSITRVLDHFEENMRSQRERRIEHEWNFCSYFLLQEELAFMYEMMGLYEDAMIQYDELDALFTQFILNSAIAEPAPWLDLMCRNIPTRWGGSCLCQPIDNIIRNLISLNKCSILDLRSYLFGRQGHLLVQLGRISELVKRSVPFIHNCIREVKILKIPVPPGAIDCWTFLSCMEVLSFCPLDNKLDSEESKMIASGAAELWNLATQKANCIGRLCGLVSTSSGQTADGQKIMELLLPGLVHIAGESEHLNRLLEVLTGKEPYIQFYLELSEQCICFLKHVSRVRSAKFTGKELADLYIMTGDYKKAENYLVDLLKMYKTEGWEMLANDVRQKLAECQKFLMQTFKYCRTSLNIASSSTVQLEMRKKCLQDALEASKSQVDVSTERMKMRCPPAFLLSLVMPSSDVALHQCVQMQLEIFSNLPSPITLDEVVLSFRGRMNIHEEKEIEMRRKHKRNISTDSAAFLTQPQKLMQRCHSRQDSGHFETRRNSQSSILGGFELFNKISETISFNFQSIDIQSSVQYVEDGNQQLAISSSLLCRSPLKRSLSSPKSQKLLSSKGVILDDDVVLRRSCVPLMVGRNLIQLTGAFSKIGSYQASMAVMKLNEIDFVQTFQSDDLNVDVTLREMKLSLKNDDLMAGFKQNIVITLTDDATESALPNSLEIHASQGLLLQFEDLSTDDENKMVLSEAILDNFKKLQHLNFRAFVALDDWTKDEKLIKQITLKSLDHVDKVFTLSFDNPFRVRHKFFTSLSKKFVQVLVSSHLVDATEINSWSLTDSAATTNLKNLNTGNSMILYSASTTAFVWQIDENIKHPLDLKFDMKYCKLNTSDVTHHLGYHFQLDDIEMRIIACSHLSRKELLSNEWVPMKFIITRVKDFPNKLFYAITHDVDSWKLSGCTSGEIRFTGNRAKVVINVLPLKCKQLKVPKITIFDETSQDKENTSEETMSPNNKFNPNWIFDASEISTVLVKPQDPPPMIHHFQAVVEACS